MKSLICAGGIALVFALASMTGAEAQKKMSYQDAFAKCKQEMGGGPLAGEGLNSSPRYTAMSGCMKKYGLRLKKNAKI
jgi:hypothetical protein